MIEIELFRKFRKDKKFRQTAIIVVILVLFLLNYTSKAPTQAFTPQPTCDGDFTRTSCEADNCYWVDKVSSNDGMVVKGSLVVTTIGTGCALGSYFGPWGIAPGCAIGLLGGIYQTGVVGWAIGLFTSPCYSCIPDGYITDDMDNCCSGYAKGVTVESISGISFLSKTSYACETPEKGDECKKWERSMAKILDGIWKKNEIDDCSTKAYLVVGAIIMIGLAVI